MGSHNAFAKSVDKLDNNKLACFEWLHWDSGINNNYFILQVIHS